MKRILRRSFFITLITIAFFIGLGVFTFRFFSHSEEWINQKYNGHIAGDSGITKAGMIFDRNGEILAQTVDEQRVYHDDEIIRKATLHDVGDNGINISTAVQSLYRNDLIGYNSVLGFGVPEEWRQSKNITLTIDSQLSKVAYQALAGKKGSVILLNYETGEILCDVSITSYDPQNPPVITEENEEEYDGAYLNRGISATYTPGSIFKIITSAAAVEHIPDIHEQTFHCSGSVEIDGEEVICSGVHGDISFENGFAQSCNVAFAEITMQLGKENMENMATKLGIESSFSIDKVDTLRGHYDVSSASNVDFAWSGIGQYTTLVNPMQMAILMSAIANDGTAITPYLLSNITSSDFSKVENTLSQSGKTLMSEDTAFELEELMRHTVITNYGDWMFPELEVCAKTGTGQVEDGKNNAWMVGFSSNEDTPIAFAVIVEDGVSGYSTAGTVASTVIREATLLFK